MLRGLFYYSAAYEWLRMGIARLYTVAGRTLARGPFICCRARARGCLMVVLGVCVCVREAVVFIFEF